MSACCVSGCKNRHSSARKLKFYRIPVGNSVFQANRRRLWLKALEQVTGSVEELKRNARICGAHFISGEASMDRESPDFVPSVFTCAKLQSPKKKGKKFYYGSRKRRRRRQTTTVETAETPGSVNSSLDQPSAVLLESTENEPSPPTPAVRKEEKNMTTDVNTGNGTPQTPPSQTMTSPLIKKPAGIPELDRIHPVVLIKPLVTPAGDYQCDFCDEKFATPSQLVNHTEQHGDRRSVCCEINGKPSPADSLPAPQDVQAGELSFPCNICDRSFPTSHNLKRHKLLHVKDGRKCHVCGTLFCQRHNHVIFQPLPESVMEYEEDFSFTKPSVLGRLPQPEDRLQEKSEPSQMSVVDDTERPRISTPSLKTFPTTAVPATLIPESPRVQKAQPPASHSALLSEMPLPLFRLPPSLTRGRKRNRPLLRYNLGTSFQYNLPTVQLPVYPANVTQHHLEEFPPSLQMFSPQYLTSAFFEVKRNYDCIFKKRQEVKTKEKNVKEECCNTPLIPPDEMKNERTAYDLEIVI